MLVLDIGKSHKFELVLKGSGLPGMGKDCLMYTNLLIK